jgi:hypothetical protein
MAPDIPDGIVLKRHRDLDSPGFNRAVRYVLVTMITAFLVLGLLNTFGQLPAHLSAQSAKATLEVYVPSRLRGGLLYEGRFTIFAHEELKNAQLELSPGWNEGMQMNTLEPGSVGEGSRGGNLLLTLGHVPKGDVYRLFTEYQVNPTNMAWRRNADVRLYDDGKLLLTIHRRITVFP